MDYNFKIQAPKQSIYKNIFMKLNIPSETITQLFTIDVGTTDNEK